MARLNLPKFSKMGREYTHESAPARRISAENQLRRSVLACLLWENQFYEEGVEMAGRIQELVPKVDAEAVAALAVEAREQMKLRHAPLFLVREMARHATHRAMVAETLSRVIQRADELAEFVAIYWKDGKSPLSAQVKRGLAKAFSKFDEYQLAKYDRTGAIRLRDVLFLCHAKPRDREQAALWKRLAQNELATPDTWEVALSSGADKRAAWERLLRERKLGALALLRNLRNFREAKVDENLVLDSLRAMKTDRVLPFRFIAAARFAPQWEEPIEKAMLGALAGNEKLAGKTVLLVDVSGSMSDALSGRSEMLRTDAAYGLAVFLREVCEKVRVFTFSNKLVEVPARRGFPLRDAMDASQPHEGTYLGRALAGLTESYDRIIVITDEQSHDRVPAPKERGYMINVASNKNGVGYGAWNHIDGWSEAVVEYIGALEKASLN
ncbi:MAG TPA: TROVE domain-containing protein [Candidatus Acidoferrales bacterium]|jgi:60 kDa SS-A/Ro ribonucleoprotein|nr:TROVE domain-containing protein [Candidatus Acidoferrales bacterium]